MEDRLRQLEEENERLRARYSTARQSQHRRTALGLAGVGLFAGGLAGVVPMVREPLIGIAAIGLFSAVLTWYLTPERFIPADVGQSVFEPLSRNEASLADQLGLSDERIYLETEAGFRLYIPQRSSEQLPDVADLTHPLVVADGADESGLSLEPSGAGLYREHRATRSSQPKAVSKAAAQLGESLREHFELVRSYEFDVDADDSRVTVELTEPAYDDPAVFDHPIVSFLGVGLADQLNKPVRVEVAELDSDAETWSVTLRW